MRPKRTPDAYPNVIRDVVDGFILSPNRRLWQGNVIVLSSRQFAVNSRKRCFHRMNGPSSVRIVAKNEVRDNSRTDISTANKLQPRPLAAT
jgi:hypothetical protein